MRVTYYDTAQSTPATATALDAQAGSDEDRILKKIIIGKPSSGAILVVYHPNNAVFGATTNIAFKHTFPTFSATNTNGISPVVIDFTAGGGPSGTNGMVLSGGGSFTTDTAMQVTFLWTNPDDEV